MSGTDVMQVTTCVVDGEYPATKGNHMHGTADSEPTLTLKVSELEEVVKRVNCLFLDKLYAHDPTHPFCRIAQEKGEWEPKQ